MTEPLQRSPSSSVKDIYHEIFNCVQCGYCSAFCEVSFVSVDSPRKVIRLLQRDNLEEAVKSSFLTLCKQCQTCSLMCPQGIDVAGIMRRLVRNRFLNY
jgi:heterodisulfide reductase subunit C